MAGDCRICSDRSFKIGVISGDTKEVENRTRCQRPRTIGIGYPAPFTATTHIFHHLSFFVYTPASELGHFLFISTQRCTFTLFHVWSVDIRTLMEVYCTMSVSYVVVVVIVIGRIEFRIALSLSLARSLDAFSHFSSHCPLPMTDFEPMPEFFVSVRLLLHVSMVGVWANEHVCRVQILEQNLSKK
ncbi:hypothetical protein U1Q18_048244 [Sarracenia purpurea var. burkii]